MSIMNQDSTVTLFGLTRRRLHGGFMERLALTAGRLHPRRLLRQLQGRNETKREFDLLSDYYLNDIGAKRSVDRKADDLVARLRLGG